MIIKTVERSKSGNIKKIFNLFPKLSLQKISFALILFSCCSLLLFFHLISIYFSSFQKSIFFAVGFPRIPGSNGI